MVSEQGFHQSLSEVWGAEVRYLMETRPDLFLPEAIPQPIDPE
jgi:hypothetical protein